jgi:hypothetical protein
VVGTGCARVPQVVLTNRYVWKQFRGDVCDIRLPTCICEKEGHSYECQLGLFEAAILTFIGIGRHFICTDRELRRCGSPRLTPVRSSNATRPQSGARAQRRNSPSALPPLPATTGKEETFAEHYSRLLPVAVDHSARFLNEGEAREGSNDTKVEDLLHL